MITVENAIETILKEIRPLGLESTDILSALGRVLGTDIRASRPNPPWDNSAMDGYAIIAADTDGGARAPRGIRAGRGVRPAEVSLLATTGTPFVMVHRRPRVAVLSTGDELADIHDEPANGKISNSNGWALCALVTAAGAEPIQLGIARDNKESLKEKLTLPMKADR